MAAVATYPVETIAELLDLTQHRVYQLTVEARRRRMTKPSRNTSMLSNRTSGVLARAVYFVERKGPVPDAAESPGFISDIFRLARVGISAASSNHLAGQPCHLICADLLLNRRP